MADKKKKDDKTPKTIHLQGIYGQHPAVKASELKPGDVTVWNGGATEKIINVEPSKSGKTVKATIEYKNLFGKKVRSTRKLNAETLVGIDKAASKPLKEPKRADKSMPPKKAAIGPRASRKDPFDIPTIDNSLRLEHKYGGLSVEDVAKKMYEAGMTRWVDVDEAKKLLAKPITATPSQIEDAKATYKFRREHASEIEAIKAKVAEKITKTTAQKSASKRIEHEPAAPKTTPLSAKKDAEKEAKAKLAGEVYDLRILNLTP